MDIGNNFSTPNKKKLHSKSESLQTTELHWNGLSESAGLSGSGKMSVMDTTELFVIPSDTTRSYNTFEDFLIKCQWDWGRRSQQRCRSLWFFFYFFFNLPSTPPQDICSHWCAKVSRGSLYLTLETTVVWMPSHTFCPLSSKGAGYVSSRATSVLQCNRFYPRAAWSPMLIKSVLFRYFWWGLRWGTTQHCRMRLYKHKTCLCKGRWGGEGRSSRSKWVWCATLS